MKQKNRKIKEEQLEDLKRDFGVLSTKEITEKYNCSYSTIERFCKSHGFKSKRSNGKNSAKKYPYPYEHVQEFLIDWENNILSIEELENKYFAPLSTLYSIAKLYGKTRKRDSEYRFTKEEELRIIADYKQGIPNNVIFEKYNIYQSMLSSIFKRNNEILDGAGKRNRIYIFDEHFLDNIDTEEKAYFLGFVYADGSHHEKRHTLNITIQKRDEILLEHFYKMFSCNKKIYDIYNKQYNKTYSNFSLQSKYLSEQLIKLGVPQNKTFKITFPSFLPNDLNRHFIRGYFDGDGGINVSHDKEKWNKISLTICGNEQFLLGINEVIYKDLNITFNIHAEGNIYKLTKGGINNVYILLNYLYKDSNIYLPRKYNIYKDFILKYESRK